MKITAPAGIVGEIDEGAGEAGVSGAGAIRPHSVRKIGNGGILFARFEPSDG